MCVCVWVKSEVKCCEKWKIKNSYEITQSGDLRPTRARNQQLARQTVNTFVYNNNNGGKKAVGSVRHFVKCMISMRVGWQMIIHDNECVDDDKAADAANVGYYEKIFFAISFSPS